VGQNRFTSPFQFRFDLSCFQSDSPIEEDLMTPASRQALKNLDDLDMLSGYAIPPIAYPVYICNLEEATVP
jgi:hypothetical protein